MESNQRFLTEYSETSTTFKTICAFSRFLNVRILNRYFPADLFFKDYCVFFIRERLGY